jgi:hypothetical protein
MATYKPSTFNFSSLKDFCWPVNSRDAFFNPEANNLYLKVFEGVAYDCTPPLNMTASPDADLFKNSPVHHHYADTHEAGEVFIAALGNARIATPYAFIFNQSGVLFNDSYHNQSMVPMPIERMEHFIKVDLQMSIKDETFDVPANTVRFDWPPKQIEEPCILLASPWCEGYHHWILETLPRLWALDEFEELRSLPVVIPAWAKQYHLDSLKAFGIDDVRILKFDGGTWDFERLYVPSFLAPGGHSERQITWVRERLRKAFGITPESTKERRLYVSRRDAVSRRLDNEAAILPLLEKYGFEVIAPGELTLAEQISKFSEAAVIAGVAGSGLTNFAFAQPGCTLIEFHPADYINPAYWFMANAAGHKYWFEIGETVNEAQDFTIEIERVEAALKAVLV